MNIRSLASLPAVCPAGCDEPRQPWWLRYRILAPSPGHAVVGCRWCGLVAEVPQGDLPPVAAGAELAWGQSDWVTS